MKADLLIHAGDVSDGVGLAYLGALGPPLVGVHGNVDDAEVRRQLAPEVRVEVAGRDWGIVHDGGPAEGRLNRLRRRFPGCAGVIFGHSHIPLHQVAEDGFWILNPGSPTDRRRQPRHSMAVITASEGGVLDVAFRAVDDPAGILPSDLIVT